MGRKGQRNKIETETLIKFLLLVLMLFVTIGGVAVKNLLPAKEKESAIKRETTSAEEAMKQIAGGELPKHLFDIKLELEEKTISEPDELTAWVSFESFGTEPTPADLTYIIMDESGNVVYSETGDIVVETEEFVIKKFDKLNLELGKYTLDLRIEYADVTEEFRQDFEVRR